MFRSKTLLVATVAILSLGNISSSTDQAEAQTGAPPSWLANAWGRPVISTPPDSPAADAATTAVGIIFSTATFLPRAYSFGPPKPGGMLLFATAPFRRTPDRYI